PRRRDPVRAQGERDAEAVAGERARLRARDRRGRAGDERAARVARDLGGPARPRGRGRTPPFPGGPALRAGGVGLGRRRRYDAVTARASSLDTGACAAGSASRTTFSACVSAAAPKVS